MFAVLRFLSGLGIGIIFGSAPALVSEFMPGRFRSLAVSVVVMGYPVGAVLAGPIANALIPEFGWASVFTAGGLLTICMGLLTLALLPESPEFLAGIFYKNLFAVRLPFFCISNFIPLWRPFTVRSI